MKTYDPRQNSLAAMNAANETDPFKNNPRNGDACRDEGPEARRARLLRTAPSLMNSHRPGVDSNPISHNENHN